MGSCIQTEADVETLSNIAVSGTFLKFCLFLFVYPILLVLNASLMCTSLSIPYFQISIGRSESLFYTLAAIN